jgi:AbrB family transcriptional regulator (stage V sporulation protein T)
VIAVSGAPKKEFMGKRISPAVEKIMEDRKPVLISRPGEDRYCKECITEDEAGSKFTSEVIAPIVAEGDPIGAVIICTREPGETVGELELKLAQTAAGFLAKQMEQ